MKNCLSSHSCQYFFNQTPSCIYSMCLYCIGKVSNFSIKSCGRSWSAHEGTIYAYTKALLGKICLSSHSCHFVKNCFFLNQTPSCICSMCLYCIGKVSNCSIKAVVGVDRPMKAPSINWIHADQLSNAISPPSCFINIGMRHSTCHSLNARNFKHMKRIFKKK